MFADSLTVFGGILSGHVAFLGFMFLIILFISSVFAVGMSNLMAGESIWRLMFKMLLWFSYYFMIFFIVVLSSVGLLRLSWMTGGTPDVFSAIFI